MLRRLRNKIWQWEGQAPFGAQVAFGALLIVALVLVFTKLITPEIFALLIVPAALVLAVWGLVRYQRSPFLQRREQANKEIDRYLASNDVEAAEDLIVRQMGQDDAEREQLRAAALSDSNAAVEFQRRTTAELAAWNRTATLFKRTVGSRPEAPAAGEKIFVTRRLELEADLEWIRAVLSNNA